ncbi:MAG: hypothetical protein ACE5HP_04885 [Gemmatimonadota bacterium]
MRPSFFRRYLLPGFIFQSVVIAGGYATGREIVEFFLTLGPVSGLAGMILVSTVIWSLVAAVSFELARRFRTYDYRSFFQRLLGRGWVLFEICYLLMMLLVLAVIGAAAGSIVEETLALPYAAGVAAVMGVVAVLLFFGSGPIERALAAWSFVLYATYAVFLVWSVGRFGGRIADAFAASELGGAWVLGGVKYASYNLSVVPVVLFTVRHIRTRREAVGAGLLTGVIGILPGLLFYIAMVGHYPEIVGRAVPANYLLELLGSRAFQVAFQIVIFGTLIETGTGMIHAVNERLAGAFQERGSEMPRWIRPAAAGVFLSVAIALTPLGLVDLIAKGYGGLTWGFLGIYVLPVLTLGVWILVRSGGRSAAAEPRGRGRPETPGPGASSRV